MKMSTNIVDKSIESMLTIDLKQRTYTLGSLLLSYKFEEYITWGLSETVYIILLLLGFIWIGTRKAHPLFKYFGLSILLDLEFY